MKAGRLRQRVTFQTLSTEQDSDGATVETWTDAFGQAISADITHLSGRELVAAQAVQSKVSARIEVRHRPGFVTSMRAVHRGTLYDIEAVIPDRTGLRSITLLCSTGADEG